jgi:RNA polymerase sigma factor (sigma-70 family)
MPKERIITKEQFDELLAWLDPDREKAAIKYETIRQSLIKIFIWRGYSEAEDMADETFDRVTKNMPKIRPTYVGDPGPYVFSVLNNLLMERGRQKKSHVPLDEVAYRLKSEDSLPLDDKEDESEQAFQCLSLCMQQLEPDKRELFLAYYQNEKQTKISDRKELAAELNIDLNALRVRVHRIRTFLEKCIEDCLNSTAGN